MLEIHAGMQETRRPAANQLCPPLTAHRSPLTRSGTRLPGTSLQKLQHRRCLVERLLVFLLEPGIGDDAAARPEADLATREHHRADRDVEIHVPIEAQVADRTAIDAAAVR